MKTFASTENRREIVRRLESLQPDSQPRWGRMSAAEMVAHLTDQMSHCLGDKPCGPVPGILRWAPLRHITIYWLPWPKGRVKGPPDAFVTRPGPWLSDIERLVGMVERFGHQDLTGTWPEHAMFGHMRGIDWGHFCYKHFDHHLSQFGR